MKNLNYQLRELTPNRYKCGASAACPAVYELVKEECAIGSCSTIYGTDDNSYIIIGKRLDPKDFGLEGKVGKDETLISIPKGLIEKLNKK